MDPISFNVLGEGCTGPPINVLRCTVLKGNPLPCTLIKVGVIIPASLVHGLDVAVDWTAAGWAAAGWTAASWTAAGWAAAGWTAAGWACHLWSIEKRANLGAIAPFLNRANLEAIAPFLKRANLRAIAPFFGM